MDLKSQLLITFTDSKNLDKTIENIKQCYNILFNKIFVLQNLDNEKELICSYNIDETKQINVDNIPPSTIGVHRKKQTNSLYTINALNYIIQVLNDGRLDKNYSVPWDKYSNCILVINNGEFKKINTKLFNIIEIK